eukprot:TRINITY_DN9996_c0_g1_i9.p1 TRINITY_DN9996_c0_g1~~TRINITY_DN9996_c0_g1_i9.p1  ORF type:complete len:623 (-),score=119.23 TRINITY_DN9996_c0_g1_i9:2844-4712(-)
MSEFVIKPRLGHEQETQQEEQSVSSRIKEALVRIGDHQSSSIEEIIETVVNFLHEEQSAHQEEIIDCLLECVQHLPLKISLYASITGILNLKNYGFVASLVAATHTQLQKTLVAGNLRKSKLLVRFLAELLNVNVILPKTLLVIFDQFLFAISSVLQSGDGLPIDEPDSKAFGRADFLIYILLMTIPYAASELHERNKEDLLSIVGRMDSYFAQRPSRLSTTLLPFDLDDEPLDRLVHLYKCMKQSQESGWANATVSKLYKRFEGKLNACVQHSMESFAVLEQSTEFNAALQLFKIFGTPPEATAYNPLDRILLEDLILDTVYFFNEARKDCVRQISSINLPYPTQEIIIETILGQLLFLPNPEFKTLYYAVLLSDISRLDTLYADAICRAVDLLFQRMGSMDIECIDRLADFVSYYLTNNDYKWEWQSFLSYAHRKETLQYYFLQYTLGGCSDMAYAERIKSVVPSELHHFLRVSSPPIFVYEDKDTQAAQIAKGFVSSIRKKESPEVVTNRTTEQIQSFSPTEKVEIVFNVCFFMGYKSFGHLGYILEKYESFLQSICNTKELGKQVLDLVEEYWGSDWLHKTTYIDRLISYKIVDGFDVIQWLFSTKRSSDATKLVINL